ncbi:MAG TPA: tRNA-dihydrouridine synthase family protein [Leptospiraceae bacterium]|nr:tRNA-dihydrouridine synthase family protein [Leptospirales bacterium]HMU81902.1 tRNA-dihydrouridine synthase family protein [Leptospiraceae bacterium]HMW58083.1 tRNA-dihydrouridine synthase family protein [Leptospiraceae bacterium]HMX55817.1 tRNA-dihydrouridine synthase family protein [Leptospiraceae bacterium]HNL02927.1 tRNA-dihydrouridine synthase family protein [Leptospiraceae bacterium]
MANFSDSPFRKICRRMGSALSFSEFVPANSIAAGRPWALDMLRFEEMERPVILQIFGNKLRSIEEAAIAVLERRPDVIDLNMGCSAREVALNGSGAGLLRTPELASAMIRSLVRIAGPEIPVSAKMRIGWDGFSRNYRDIALMIEDSGASMISVHGRTREEGYGGIADWDAIAEVKSMVRIPVIGSGDVSSRLDAENRIAQFGVDGVLVGRAAMGNPWIFSGIRRSALPREQITSVIKEHFLDMLTFYGDHAVILFRKHATRYAAEFPQHERLALLSCETPSEFLDRLEECAQAEKLEATAIA